MAIRFNLSSISVDATVSSAVLTFNVYQISQGYQDPGAKISVHKIMKAWDQNTVTWLKASASSNWAQAGGDYSSAAVVTSGYSNSGTESFAITPAIQDFVRTPSSNFGVYLKVATSKIQKHGIRSSEYATVAQRPKLVVTYTGGSTAVTRDQARRIRQGSIHRTVVAGMHDASGTHTAADRIYGINGQAQKGDWKSAGIGLRFQNN